MANITGTSRFLRILAERGTTGLVELVDEDLSFNGNHTIQSIGGTLTINAFTLGGAVTGAAQVLSNLGTVYVGDTANANQTLGLTINQGTADDEILSLKSSDISHPRTGVAEADTYASFGKSEGDGGGLTVRAFLDSNTTVPLGMVHSVFSAVNANTDKTTAGFGLVDINARQVSGDADADVVANGNLLSIRGRSTSIVARFLFDIEGSAHADVEWVAFDRYNDLALVKDTEMMLLDRETEAQTYRRHELETAGIIGKDSWHFEKGKPRAMVNFTKLAMLHHGALIQVAERMSLIEAENKLLREQVAGRLR